MEQEAKKEEKFSYESLWDEDETKEAKKELKDMSKGLPRKGIKGKYLKRKNHVTKGQIKYSYITGFKRIKGKE